MGEGDSDLAMLDEASKSKHGHSFGTAIQDATSLPNGIAVVLLFVMVQLLL